MCSFGCRKKLFSDKLCMASCSLTSGSFSKSVRIRFEVHEVLLTISIVHRHVVHQDFDLATSENQIDISSGAIRLTRDRVVSINPTATISIL